MPRSALCCHCSLGGSRGHSGAARSIFLPAHPPWGSLIVLQRFLSSLLLANGSALSLRENQVYSSRERVGVSLLHDTLG